MRSKSIPEKGYVGYVETSSDDECLSEVKRKSSVFPNNVKSDDDSDDGTFLPSVFVSVEVEEVEDQPLNYSKKKKEEKPAPKSKRKRNGKVKQKQKQKQKQKVFSCSSCSAKFTKSADLKEHSVIHKPRHKCDECSQSFTKAFSLKIHKRVHRKVEKCPVCDQAFTLKVQLTRHLTSTHEQSEQCETCPAKFYTKHQLEVHSKIHEQIPLPQPLNQPSNHNLHPFVNQTPDVQSQLTDTNISESGYSSKELDPVKQEIDINELPHATKCAIVTKLHKGRPISDICRLYNLTAAIVNDIWEKRDKYTLPKRVGIKTTQYMNSVLDTQIIEWFNNQRAQDIQVSGQMLQDIAESFAKECGFVYFNGNRKWLDRFKKKYNITLKGLRKRDYTNLPSESKWKLQFFKDNWCDVRFQIPDENIYTADEVGLFYNTSKGRIRKMTGKKFIQGNIKDRLSILMCTNVTGSDKKRLFVCGIDDPLIRSLRDPNSLPVQYIRQSQAHFTTEMFEEFVNSWNRELQTSNTKAILILDRATIHSKLQLSHLKLVFVPWKATRSLMPIQNGIFSAFRDEFRKLILQQKVRNVLRGIDRNLTCLEGLNMLGKAWEKTSPEMINKAFIDVGYDVQPINTEHMENIDDIDEVGLCSILKDYDIEPYYTDLAQLDMYLTVDEELLTGQGTNCSVFGGNHRILEAREITAEKEEILPIGTERPDTDEIEVLVEKARAVDNLATIQKYLEASNTSYDMFCKLMEVDKSEVKDPLNYSEAI